MDAIEYHSQEDDRLAFSQESDSAFPQYDDPQSERHTVPFRPLTDFIKVHTRYLGTGDTFPDYECPICRDTVSESHERMIQIDLSTCHHIFGATCFETYIQRSHTCPMCRALWFEQRLPPETPSSMGQIRVEITVANHEIAERLAEALDPDQRRRVSNLLGRRVFELSDTEADDADSEDETSDNGSDSESGIPEEDGNAVEMVIHEEGQTPLARTLRIPPTRREPASGSTTDTDSNVSGVSRREISGSMEMGPGDGDVRSWDWNGRSRRAASDDEAVQPPRQRRRYD